LIPSIAGIPEIILNILTLDTNGQHSTWLYDKRDDLSFVIAHYLQNSIISTAPRMEFNVHTSIATRELAVDIQTFQHHRILRTKLLNQEWL
jgi:hypothetical protein